MDIISPLTNPELYDQSEIMEMVYIRKKERGEEREEGTGKVRQLIERWSRERGTIIIMIKTNIFS